MLSLSDAILWIKLARKYSLKELENIAMEQIIEHPAEILGNNGWMELARETPEILNQFFERLSLK